MKTITFYSYKGGVGRTLALSNMASRLAEMGKKVCLLDFDLEAPGLHYKFKRNISPKEISKGLVDYVNDFAKVDRPPFDLSEYLTDIHFSKKHKASMHLMPAGGFSENTYWKELSKINWHDLLYKEDSIGIKLFLQLKNRIKNELNPDFLLIDSRTGITDISGITLSILADEVVLLSANNSESIDGSKQVLKAILNKNNNISGKIPKIHLVLSRIPKQDDNRFKEEILIRNHKNSFNDYFIKSKIDYTLKDILVIHSDRDLELQESFKIEKTVNYQLKEDIHPIYNDYIKLFESITKNDFKPEELQKFKILKEAELLIEESSYENNQIKKIELLKKSSQLNSESIEVYFRLGEVYSEAMKYEEAISSFKKALKLNPKSYKVIYSLALSYHDVWKLEKAFESVESGLKIRPKDLDLLILKGVIFIDLNKYKEAINIYEDLVKNYNNKSILFNNYGHALRKLNRFEEALTMLHKAIEINPTSGMTYATLAELSIDQGNMQEFYKNFELAIQFKANIVATLIDEFETYKKVSGEDRFLRIISRENIDFNEVKSKYLKRQVTKGAL